MSPKDIEIMLTRNIEDAGRIALEIGSSRAWRDAGNEPILSDEQREAWLDNRMSKLAKLSVARDQLVTVLEMMRR